MNVTEQMSLAQKYAELWGTLFPDAELPGSAQFTIWAGSYSQDQVVQGINRAARKSRKMRDTGSPMSAIDVIRYASSVMKNEQRGFHDFSGNRRPGETRHELAPHTLYH